MTDETADRISFIRDKMKSGDFHAALRVAEDVLAGQVDHQDALYMAAVCSRYLGNVTEASGYLDRLKRAAPDFGRAFQEDGHLHLSAGDVSRALSAYRLAVRYNPALLASWQRLTELAAAQGDAITAREANAQLKRLQALPKELLAVMNHVHEGRVLRGEEIVRAYLQKNPRDVEGMRLLADIGVRLSVLTDADFLLETAISLAPDYLQLRIDHIQVLRKRQKYAAALSHAQHLYRTDPSSPLFQSLLAIEHMHSGDIGKALDLFAEVLSVNPNDLAALTSRGHAQKTYGLTEDAIRSYRQALAVDPLHGDAWYGLANLKTYRFSDQDIEDMQSALTQADLSLMSRIHILFALGKAFEDAGRQDEAFSAFEQGNALKKRQARYTAEHMQAEFDAQKRYCTPALFAERSGVGHSAPDPIFIVGLPRAGSTLLEQILASHSRVDGTLELPNILSIAHRLRGRNMLTDRDRYPRILQDLSDEDLARLGQDYLDGTRTHRKAAPFFTDKMPNNFRHIGLIHLILPNARIIDARRNPLDCCWSGFKQLFAEGQEFTYGLEDIGGYYRGYVDLMNHWHAVLPPGRILTVQHEDVLTDLDGQVRRILDYCGLPFEEACVRFHETRRPVRTASSEQVRQPINTSGLEQWRPYEAHLGPLKMALGPALTDI